METVLVSQRLPKTCLIRKGWEYDEVYSRGKRLHAKGFSLICVSNSSLESRLGISIHRKLRGAVKRNRIKRIIRESFRVERKHFPQGMNIVFAVRPDFGLKNPGEIVRAVLKLTAGISSCQTP